MCKNKTWNYRTTIRELSIKPWGASATQVSTERKIYNLNTIT